MRRASDFGQGLFFALQAKKTNFRHFFFLNPVVALVIFSRKLGTLNRIQKVPQKVEKKTKSKKKIWKKPKAQKTKII